MPEKLCCGTVGLPAPPRPLLLPPVNPVAFQRRNLDNPAAERAGQLLRQFFAAPAHDVHHVNGDDDRYAQLKQLGGQIQVAFEVGSVDNVEYRVRPLANEIFRATTSSSVYGESSRCRAGR